MKEAADSKKMIGRNIKRFRTMRGMSQRQMAERLWIDRSSLSAYETGKRTPDIFMLCRIADLFEITLDSLAGRNIIGKECMPDWKKAEDNLVQKEILVEKKNL